MCTLSVGNMICHKFSHMASSYTHNGKNVNLVLESEIISGEKKIMLLFGIMAMSGY